MSLKDLIIKLLPRRRQDSTDEDYHFTPEIEVRARAGDPVAQARLGTAYHEGLGVDPNPERAFNWFLAAARQGHAGGQLMVAASYDAGKVVGRDPIQAAYWATLSSAGGNMLGDAFRQSVVRRLNEDQKRELLQLLKDRHPTLFQ